LIKCNICGKESEFRSFWRCCFWDYDFKEAHPVFDVFVCPSCRKDNKISALYDVVADLMRGIRK